MTSFSFLSLVPCIFVCVFIRLCTFELWVSQVNDLGVIFSGRVNSDLLITKQVVPTQGCSSQSFKEELWMVYPLKGRSHWKNSFVGDISVSGIANNCLLAGNKSINFSCFLGLVSLQIGRLLTLNYIQKSHTSMVNIRIVSVLYAYSCWDNVSTNTTTLNRI